MTFFRPYAVTPNRALSLCFRAPRMGPSGRQLRVEDFAGLAEGEKTLQDRRTFHFERLVPLYTVPENIQERFCDPHRTIFGAGQPPDGRHSAGMATSEKGWTTAPGPSRIFIFPGLCSKKNGHGNARPLKNFGLETALGRLREAVKRQRAKTHQYTLRRHLLTPFRLHLGFEFTAPQSASFARFLMI